MRLATERQRLLIICKRKHVAFQFRVFALLHIRLNGKREGTNGGKWKIRNNSFALYVKGQLDKHGSLLHLPGNAEIPPQRHWCWPMASHVRKGGKVVLPDFVHHQPLFYVLIKKLAVIRNWQILWWGIWKYKYCSFSKVRNNWISGIRAK